MKRYNFSVKVEGVDDIQSTLIDSFVNEAKKDGKEQLVTETINIETSKVHKKILFDFSTAINLQLEKIGLELSIDDDVYTAIYLDLYKFLRYYNNNYRPIYHLESIMFYIIKKIHNYNELTESPYNS